jgi:hypothetical protein
VAISSHPINIDPTVETGIVSYQVGKNLGLLIHRSQVRKQIYDQAFFIYDHRRASSFSGVCQIPFIPRVRHAKGDRDGPIAVEQDRKGQVFPLDPFSDRFLVPVVDAKDRDILCGEVRMVVTVPVTVAGSIAAAWRREEP